MTSYLRKRILRANAIYLATAAVLGFFLLDVRGIYFDTGPVSRVINGAPHTAIGFVESHGLALILAVVFWRVAPERFWHLVAMATTGLLGTANLVFWQIFVDTDTLAMGYVATSLHWVFALTQLFAAIAVKQDRASSAAARPALS